MFNLLCCKSILESEAAIDDESSENEFTDTFKLAFKLFDSFSIVFVSVLRWETCIGVRLYSLVGDRGSNVGIFVPFVIDSFLALSSAKHIGVL